MTEEEYVGIIQEKDYLIERLREDIKYLEFKITGLNESRDYVKRIALDMFKYKSGNSGR